MHDEPCPLHELIALSDLPSYLPKRGGRLFSRATVYRWAAQGKGGVRLKTIVIGDAQFTSPSWLREFLEANGTQGAATKGRTSPRRLSAGPNSVSAITRARLDKHGL